MCVFLSAFVSGCAKSDLSPERAYTQFFGIMQFYAQDQNRAYLDAAFFLLSSSSRARLTSKAKDINQSLPPEAHVEPSSLLFSTGVPMGAPISKIERVEESSDRVVLEIVLPSGTSRATMVKEDGRWLVDLEDIHSPQDQIEETRGD